jgi:hypothetical protein
MKLFQSLAFITSVVLCVLILILMISPTKQDHGTTKATRTTFPKKKLVSAEESALCKDISGKFKVVLPSSQVKRQTCIWIKRKADVRCKFDGVRNNCPKTCDQACNTSLQYPWCIDNKDRFFIDSIPYLVSGKRSCTWAEAKRFIRCRIPEVKQNCPVLCDYCKCTDNQNRFHVSQVEGNKLCKWTKRKHTEKRCNKFLEMKENCPYTCGECNIYPFAVIETTSSIKLRTRNFPADEDTLLKSIKGFLIVSFTSFLPASEKVTNLDLLRESRGDGGWEEIEVTFVSETRVICSGAGSAGCEEDIQSHTSAMNDAVSAAVLSKNSDLGHLVEAAAADTGISISARTTGIYDSQSIGTLQGFVNPTKNPTSHPTQIPSDNPSDNPSSTPSDNPTNDPTRSPTSRPTSRPTSAPTAAPTTAPTTTPTATPATAFQNKSDLINAAITWCSDTAGWANTPGYSTYGYVSSKIMIFAITFKMLTLLILFWIYFHYLSS